LRAAHHHPRLSLLTQRAWAMRRHPTPTEQALWLHLSAGKLGVAFKRQVPLAGSFIVDFFAPSRGLIVEVEGLVHSRRKASDERRTRKLERLGYRVLRIEASLVEEDVLAAVALVRAALEAPP
jgi:very-short-patch-repair endonuclease